MECTFIILTHPPQVLRICGVHPLWCFILVFVANRNERHLSSTVSLAHFLNHWVGMPHPPPSVQVYQPLLWTLLSHCCCHWWMNSWWPCLEFSWLITMPRAFGHFYTLLSTRLLYMTQFFTLEASRWMFSYCLITNFYHSMASLHWLIGVNEPDCYYGTCYKNEHLFQYSSIA